MLSTIQQQCVAGDEASREMKAKSGRLWSKVAPPVHSRGLQDIIRTPSGICREAHAENEMIAFNLLITPEMLDVIARETNREAERKVAAWNEANPHNIQEWNATSITEIQAVIGLVILRKIGATGSAMVCKKWASNIHCCHVFEKVQISAALSSF